jgi:hypothetical protein
MELGVLWIGKTEMLRRVLSRYTAFEAWATLAMAEIAPKLHV